MKKFGIKKAPRQEDAPYIRVMRQYGGKLAIVIRLKPDTTWTESDDVSLGIDDASVFALRVDDIKKWVGECTKYIILAGR